VADVAIQLGRVFERRRNADALRALSERIRQQDKELRDLPRKLTDSVSQHLPAVRLNLEKLREAAEHGNWKPAKELTDSVKSIDSYLAETRTLLCRPLAFQKREVLGPRAEFDLLKIPDGA
jgi:signal transduction histidine kinase